MEFETVDASKAWQHVLRVHLDLGIGDISRTTVDLLDDALHIVALALALAPLLQFQREVTIRRRLLEVVTITSDGYGI